MIKFIQEHIAGLGLDRSEIVEQGFGEIGNFKSAENFLAHVVADALHFGEFEKPDFFDFRGEAVKLNGVFFDRGFND